ncbi:MAG TPA: hypothetical protein VFG47_20590, partial [Geminicoccaceae bacterium]|nr:hypothetical protein [Geminicoccaceae bacterium]
VVAGPAPASDAAAAVAAAADAAAADPLGPDYPPELLRDFGASIAALRTGVVQWYVAPIPGFEKAGPFALGGLDLHEVDRAWDRGERRATPAMLGHPMPGTTYEKQILPGHAVRFAFLRPEHRAWFAELDGRGGIIVAFLGWCGYGFGRPFDGKEAHAAHPDGAAFHRYDYAGGYRVFVFQKGDRLEAWERGGAGIIAAANASLAGYLADPNSEQRYLRPWQPVFRAGGG